METHRGFLEGPSWRFASEHPIRVTVLTYSAKRLPKVRILYLFLTVILPYLQKKLYSLVMNNPVGWREKVLKFLTTLDKIYMLANLVNLSIFIRNGEYRSLTQRVLKLPMEFINGESARVLNFSLMNRRLIWRVY